MFLNSVLHTFNTVFNTEAARKAAAVKFADFIVDGPNAAFELRRKSIQAELADAAQHLRADFSEKLITANQLEPVEQFDAIDRSVAENFSAKAETGLYWHAFYQYLIKEHTRRPSQTVSEDPWPRSMPSFGETSPRTPEFQWRLPGFQDRSEEFLAAASHAQSAINDLWLQKRQDAEDRLKKAVQKRDSAISRLSELAFGPKSPEASGNETSQGNNLIEALSTAAGVLSKKIDPQIQPALIERVSERLATIDKPDREIASGLDGENSAKAEKSIRLDDYVDAPETLLPDADVDKEVQTCIEATLRTAWHVFRKYYFQAFLEEQEEQTRLEWIWDRLNSGYPVKKADLTNVQFDSAVWPQVISGWYRVVLNSDGVSYVRQARAGENTPRAPFNRWATNRERGVSSEGLTRFTGPSDGHEGPLTPEYRYLDWTPLPHRAVNPPRDFGTETEEEPDAQTLDFSVGNTHQLEGELIRFAAEVSGKSVDVKEDDAETFGRLKALQTVLYRDILELPGFDIIAGWLERLASRMSDAERAAEAGALFDRAKFGLAASIDQSGFISICISVPDGLASSDLLSRDVADALALSVAHIMKFAVDRDAVGDGGPGADLVARADQSDKATPGEEAYDLHSAVLWPVAIRRDGPGSKAGIVSQSREMLTTGSLSTAMVDEGSEAGLVTVKNAFFEADKALVALSSRFGRVLDRSLPHLILAGGQSGAEGEGGKGNKDRDGLYGATANAWHSLLRLLGLSPADAASQREFTKEDFRLGKKLVRPAPPDVYQAITRFFRTSSITLGCVFLLFCIVATFVKTDAFTLTTNEFSLMAVLFFAACLLRMYAAYGIGRIANQAVEVRQSVFRSLGRRYAGLFFFNRWTTFVDVIALSIVAGVCLFENWLDFSGIPGASTTEHVTFKGVMSSTVWALPAIGAGLLAQAITNIYATVTELKEETGERVALGRLKWVRESADTYNAQLRHVFGGKIANPNQTARAFQQMLARLPDFKKAEEALNRAEARVEGLVAQRRRGFVRSSAVTVAVITFLGGLGPVKSLKPDEAGSADLEARHAVLRHLIGGINGQNGVQTARLADPARVASLGSSYPLLVSETAVPGDVGLFGIEECTTPKDTAYWTAESEGIGQEKKKRVSASQMELAYLQALMAWCQRAEVSRLATELALNAQNARKELDAKLSRILSTINGVEGGALKVDVEVGNVVKGRNATDGQSLEEYVLQQIAGPDGSIPVDVEVTKVLAPGDVSAEEHVRKGIVGPASGVPLDVVLSQVKTPDGSNALAYLLAQIADENGRVPVDVLLQGVLAPDGSDLSEFMLSQVTAGAGKLNVPVGLQPDDPDFIALRQAIGTLQTELQKEENTLTANLAFDTTRISDAVAALGEEGSIDDLTVTLVPDAGDLQQRLDETGPLSVTATVDLELPDEVSVPVTLQTNPGLDEFVARVQEALDGLEMPEIPVQQFDPEQSPDSGLVRRGLPQCAPVASFFFDQGARRPGDIVCADYVWDAQPQYDSGFGTGLARSQLSGCSDFIEGIAGLPDLNEKSLFLPDDLTPDAVLAKVSDLVADRFDGLRDKNTGNSDQLVVVGYADSTGPRHVNARFAQERADSIEAEMLSVIGPFSRVSAIGRGEEARLPYSADGLLLRNAFSRRADVLHCKPFTEG
ncbi:hypothetical protein [uncultured Roseobacter sp.]|uniref:hypothetical protein n=1 Tax=uncultured Roseobacter sp. TaxID=114847 RepID=UPI0026279565|nr:hypothetical protein [uncultured Roseobacter sp.]